MNTDENNNEFCANCFALTIRKSYRMTILSNVVDTFKRLSLKVLLNVGMLNFLGIIF